MQAFAYTDLEFREVCDGGVNLAEIQLTLQGRLENDKKRSP